MTARQDKGLSTARAAKEDRDLLAKAQEVAELFQRAVKLGYSITFSPEQLKLLIAICEEARLTKSQESGPIRTYRRLELKNRSRIKCEDCSKPAGVCETCCWNSWHKQGVSFFYYCDLCLLKRFGRRPRRKTAKKRRAA